MCIHSTCKQGELAPKRRAREEVAGKQQQCQVTPLLSAREEGRDCRFAGDPSGAAAEYNPTPKLSSCPPSKAAGASEASRLRLAAIAAFRRKTSIR